MQKLTSWSSGFLRLTNSKLQSQRLLTAFRLRPPDWFKEVGLARLSRCPPIDLNSSQAVKPQVPNSVQRHHHRNRLDLRAVAATSLSSPNHSTKRPQIWLLSKEPTKERMHNNRCHRLTWQTHTAHRQPLGSFHRNWVRWAQVCQLNCFHRPNSSKKTSTAAPSHPSSRQAHPISSQRLPSRQWVSKDKTGLATWCKEVTTKVKMEVVGKPSTLVGTTFRFLTSASSKWLGAWSARRGATWSASFRNAPRTCPMPPRLSSLDSGARALASRRDLNKRNQKNPCICASVLVFTNSTCSRVTRSSNYFWTSTKSSRSTVNGPEKT